jgi:hypothetical protein
LVLDDKTIIQIDATLVTGLLILLTITITGLSSNQLSIVTLTGSLSITFFAISALTIVWKDLGEIPFTKSVEVGQKKQKDSVFYMHWSLVFMGAGLIFLVMVLFSGFVVQNALKMLHESSSG